MKNTKLDYFDRKIIFELDKNARSTTTAIGKTIKKSKQFVDYRIKRLEKEQLLTGYNTVIDYSRLGFHAIRIYFKFHSITRKQQNKIEKELTQDKEVWWLVTLEGKWHVGFAIAVKNHLEFYMYWDRIMSKYRQYITKSSVVTYSHIEQYPKSCIVQEKNEAKGTLVGRSSTSMPTNKLSMDLLRIISHNGRMHLLEIANRLKTSPQVIRRHMKKLQKSGIIQGYRANIDVSKLGYRYYKSYLNFLNTKRLPEIHRFFLEHPNILNVNRVIGGCDLEIEIMAKSFNEFDSIMDELKEKFSDMIESYEFVIAREEKKMEYFPFG